MGGVWEVEGRGESNIEYPTRNSQYSSDSLDIGYSPAIFSGGRGRPPSKWNASGAFSVARHGVARFDARTAALR